MVKISITSNPATPFKITTPEGAIQVSAVDAHELSELLRDALTLWEGDAA